MDKKIKIIAFYLPQFHPIPENDKAYGDGFTEWTNTKKAKPLFEGHYQPRTPLNEDYYDLLDENVMIKQAKLARENGIYGFCYYHYWFKGGHKLLEKPIETMLKNPKIDIPFCLCWANENWTRKWDGGNNEVIVYQDYGDLNELDEHVDYLCNFFNDSRYIRIDGKPILLIYKPELIPNLTDFVIRMRNRASKNGHEIYLVVQFPDFYRMGKNLSLFDFYIKFEPKWSENFNKHLGIKKWQKMFKQKLFDFLQKVYLEKLVKAYNRYREYKKEKKQKLTHLDYDKVWNAILNAKITDKRLIAGAFVDWDNTARNKFGTVFDNVSPQKFECFMYKLVEKVKKEFSQPLIFINAWNEWAEGAYLEPDQKYGYAYIDALKRVLEHN